MDNFSKLTQILQKNPIKRLQILHDIDIITVRSGHENVQIIEDWEINPTLNFLLKNYEYAGTILIQDLLKNQRFTTLSIWDNKIVVLCINISRTWRSFFCRGNKYNFKVTSFFLELNIDNYIYTEELEKLLLNPSKLNIQKFLAQN